MKRRAKAKEVKSAGSKHVVVVGLGNIGSPLVGLLARNPLVARLTLVDRDCYEKKNLVGQTILPSHVGKPKAVVQAGLVRMIKRQIKVDAIHDAIESVPLGCLRGDVILACLDSSRARQTVNQIATRLGIPCVDAGVMSDMVLARIDVYVPGIDKPCLECAWDERDYSNLEQDYPCQVEPHTPAPTNAPAHLGNLAASLQAVECEKVLTGSWHMTTAGRQVVLAAATHKLYETNLVRNPKCRFDHNTWSVERMPGQLCTLTLGALLKYVSKIPGCGRRPTLRVEGKVFLRKLCCMCGHERPVFCLSGRLRPKEDVCPKCGKKMMTSGFDMLERVSANAVPRIHLKSLLTNIGFRSGDVFIVNGGETDRYYEINDDPV